jgi:hypothetical protein
MTDVSFVLLMAWPILASLSLLVLCISLFAAWRGLSGWGLRLMAGVGLIAVLANPVLRTEETQPLTDIVVLMVDATASQSLGERAEQTAQARAQIEARIANLTNTELRIVTLHDDADNRGSQMMTRLSEALQDEPHARLAGAIILSDGRIHDAHITPDLPAPLHLILTGDAADWDRRLILRKAPAFAILGEEFSFTLEVEDTGAVPSDLRETIPLFVSIDGRDPIELSIPVGREVDVPLTLRHGGINTLHFTIADEPGELTAQNNQAVVQVNGVRDRLRVLLVSGEPHNGERTWRNILTSDAAVDLVHFTILRPTEKQDDVPISELSLIAFPTRELFMEKVDDFDLIVFDRYKLRGILPLAYLENIARYAEQGGAILVSAGPDFASANSLYHSPLSRVIPAQPTGRVFEQGYHPRITDLGARHPLTRDLGGAVLPNETPTWGRWFRQIELEPTSGDVLMSGIDDSPLLVLDHVGTGRVAVLGSDHAWLWARGVEGGGPQTEMLRRLAHWMMGEPDLEEEMLSADANGGALHVTRRTLSRDPQRVEIISPDGTAQIVELPEGASGDFAARLPGLPQGVYRLKDVGRDADQTKEAVVVIGPASAREFEQTIASSNALAPLIRAQGGGVFSFAEGGVPDIRKVGEGRPAVGRSWIGITAREASTSLSFTQRPLVPNWGWALLIIAAAIGAWLKEGRRS